MEAIFNTLFSHILSGANPGVLAILLIIIAGLGYIMFKRDAAHAEERKELVENFQKQIENDREELFKILEKYQEGQLNVVQAMNEIKVLIATIGARL